MMSRRMIFLKESPEISASRFLVIANAIHLANSIHLIDCWDTGSDRSER